MNEIKLNRKTGILLLGILLTLMLIATDVGGCEAKKDPSPVAGGVVGSGSGGGGDS